LRSVRQIEHQVNFAAEKTKDWALEKLDEHINLLLEVKKANHCLGWNRNLVNRVNSANLAAGVKILRFPTLT
jgi:formyltetrahydrofolate hydrolase